MKITTSAVAGTLESSDVYVKAEPSDQLEIAIESVETKLHACACKCLRTRASILESARLHIGACITRSHSIPPTHKSVYFGARAL